MSGFMRPAAPVVVPSSGSVMERLAALTDAINRKADRSTTPVYAAVLLIAPDGATWRVGVDSSGALTTEQVART